MNDIIQISQKVFLDHKNVEPELAIKEKLNTLLDKFACFHDYTAFQSYSKPKKHNHHSHNNHHHSHHHIPVNRTKLVNKTQTSMDRELTGLLNKLTKQNYNAILRQILKMTNDANINLVVSSILNICHIQSCYIDLYISVLNEFYTKSNNENRALIHKLLSDYIQEFIEHKEFKHYQLDSLNYDEFCNNLTNKNQIIGKHKTILAVIIKILRNNLIDEYFNIMFNEIIQMDNKDFVKEGVEKHELLLDIMTDFVKVDNKYRKYIEKYYTSHSKILQNYSVKAKFKVLDMTHIS
jgi:hypothetical protein